MRLMQWWNAWSPVKLTVGLWVSPVAPEAKRKSMPVPCLSAAVLTLTVPPSD